LKFLSIILTLCIYTQSFGYIALSVTSHKDCQSTSKHTAETHGDCHKNKTTSCCSSMIKSECDNLEPNDKNNCTAEKDIDKDDKGCCGDKDCDCNCCFHFQGLQSLYITTNKHNQSLNLENYYKSKYNYLDAIQKDLLASIFHPPQV
jgi:hypothetical protein